MLNKNITRVDEFVLLNSGFCDVCDSETVFESYNAWLRDNYFCRICRSVPRERAIMSTIKKLYGRNGFNKKMIHESSPSPDRYIYNRFKQDVRRYLPTQYYPDQEFGSMIDGFQNENLEKQTFKNGIFDIVITLDVMEHVYNPKKVFKEVERTLKSGGRYIFTVPMINKHRATEQWAKFFKGENVFIHEPEYHGNPVDKNGSPVTWHWGFDITTYIKKSSGMYAEIISEYSQQKGILGEYNEVVVCIKQ